MTSQQFFKPFFKPLKDYIPWGAGPMCTSTLPDSARDSHTLYKNLRKARELAGTKIFEGFVDKGYKDHEVNDTKIYMFEQKRGVRRTIKKRLKILERLAPRDGLEPPTQWLTATCSTD